MDYLVRDHDTIEGIAACHDCTVGELVKLNKMHSRMVFPGQKLTVPIPLDSSSDIMANNVTNDGYMLLSSNSSARKGSAGGRSIDLDVRPPGGAVRQNRLASDASNISTFSREQAQLSRQASGNSAGPQFPDPDDTECLRRFLKVKVKQVTESDGTVTGTLLITPNTIMFDPDLIHPLVKENGPDLYGMVANMDDIVSVSVYKHDHSLVEETQSTEEKRVSEDKPTFDCGATEEDYKLTEDNSSVDTTSEVFADADGSSAEETTNGNGANPPLSLAMSIDPPLPSIQEEHTKGTPTPDNPPSTVASQSLHADLIKRRANSDIAVSSQLESEPSMDSVSIASAPSAAETDRPRAHSDLQPSSSLDSSGSQKSGFSRFSPNMTRRSFGRLGRTLSNRASSLKGTVTSGAQTVASGTQRVAHGVVTHTKSAADHIQSGIQTGAKAVASVPGSLVNVGSGVLKEGQDLCNSFVAELKGGEPVTNPHMMKREKSLATLESLRQKTHEARLSSLAQNMEVVFANAANEDAVPELFAPIQDMVTCNNPPVIGTPPDPPFYMTIRVDRKRMTKKKRINYDDAFGGSRHASVGSTSDFDQSQFGNKRRCEFWFAIPRTSADAIYHFLLIWSPGQSHCDEAENAPASAGSHNFSSDNSVDQPATSAPVDQASKIGSKKGLIVLNSHSEDLRLAASGRLDNQNWFGTAFGSGLVRAWEIITVRELCRRLSLDAEYDVAEIPLPEGALQSQILDEFMIRQIAEVLPPRAEGYPWVLIYNSEKHGFSLATLYRKMEAWVDEVSPILLIIRDVNGHVFGAMVSTAIRPADHYYGTADACFLFRFTGKVPHTRELRHYEWTGNNQFFVNATRDTFAIGAGQGHSGLWLDADLNHGRSQRCATFDNEPLAGGQNEDFIVQFVEAFGFSMS